MSVKANSGVRLDSEAMATVVDAVTNFLAQFEENRQRFNKGKAIYLSEGMFEGGTVNGADLNEKVIDTFKTCDAVFDDNMEKLQKFAEAIKKIAEQLNVNTSTLDSAISELSDNIARKAAESKNAAN